MGLPEFAMETKSCKICGQNKDLFLFANRKRKDQSLRYAHQCQECNKTSQQNRSKKHYINNREVYLNRQKQYYQNNKKEIISKNKTYVLAHNQEIQEYKKQYRIDNAQFITNYQRQYRKNNDEYLKKTKRIYYIQNHSKLILQSKQYYYHNKEKTRSRLNIYLKRKWRQDASYRLRKIVSSSIRKYLKTNNSLKFNHSCISYLPFSISELKIYLESQFEPWMTWNNHSVYNSKIWDDHDIDTWTWQIDHIVPQSDLKYISMIDDNFKICWSLSNLRPLSAKQNYLDGMMKVRHNKGIDNVPLQS